MCGRYSLARDQKQVQEDFPSFDILLTLAPRYNIAPTQPVAVLLDDGRRRMEIMNWGLVPPWSSGPGTGAPLINARSDTVAEKPSFRNAFRRKRCLMPADGWYEWSERLGPRHKRPYYFHFRNGRAFAFAGLWEEWHAPDGSLVVSCAMITTEPNDIAAAVHDRMPVILDPEDYDAWLDRAEGDPVRLRRLLRPCPDEWIDVHPVSTHVNRVAHDDALCIAPAPARSAGPEQLDLFG